MTEIPSLHPDTRMGAVALTVADMDRALDFYQNTLGFRLRERDGATATLVAGEEPLVVLTEEPGRAPRAPPRHRPLPLRHPDAPAAWRWRARCAAWWSADIRSTARPTIWSARRST